MKSVAFTLCMLACIYISSASATETPIPDATDVWFDVESDDQILEAENKMRCAKEEKKAIRKSLWASFWLGFASGLGNSSLARREADVKFTDRNGNTSRGTITYTDPYRYAYLQDRDRQFNKQASSLVAANHLQKSGCR